MTEESRSGFGVKVAWLFVLFLTKLTVAVSDICAKSLLGLLEPSLFFDMDYEEPLAV